MTDTSELVRRLRRGVVECDDADLIDASNRLEALESENKRLRAALAEIASLHTNVDGGADTCAPCFKIARAALKETEG
jgi:hypothetical protein